MIPILYSSIIEGTVPNDYGIGALTDALSCKVKEDRNGAFELTLEYASNGIHAEEIQPDRIIKAKPNFADDPQLFRIYKVGKNMNGRFEVNAQHISYDLSGKVITSGSALSCETACEVLESNAGSFTIRTDKETGATFKITEPSSVRSWFGGKKGSLLDTFGGGEWHYDNFDCFLHAHRGTNRGVEIRYGKNLTQLSQEIDIQNLCTGVIPYYKDEENDILLVGETVPTGLVSDVPREIAVDFSSDCNIESSVPMEMQLSTLATRYISNRVLTRATSSIKLDFVQLSSLEERVDLCDTVKIYFEALGISSELKCISTTWDVLKDRYSSTTFGDLKTDITDTIAEQSEKLFVNDTNITNINQSIVDNDVTFYAYANTEEANISPEVETEIAQLAFISTKETTVKLLHEFIFDLTADLAKDGSYEIRYYLDDELVDYQPFERLGTVNQLIEGDLTDLTITRDFFYVVRDIEPHVRHVWKVKVLTHNIANLHYDVNHVNVTLEGQKLFSERYFDGYIDIYDYLTIYPIGSLALVGITEACSASVTNPEDYHLLQPTDSVVLESIGSVGMIDITEGTGLDAPSITLTRGFPWGTEGFDFWATEDGKKWFTD